MKQLAVSVGSWIERLALRASLDYHQEISLFFPNILSFIFYEIQNYFCEPDVGKTASHMKLQTNNALSYYINNLIAPKTQRETEREGSAVPQPGR